MMPESKLPYLKTPLKYCPVILNSTFPSSLKKQNKKDSASSLSKAPVPPKCTILIWAHPSHHTSSKSKSLNSLCLVFLFHPFTPRDSQPAYPQILHSSLHATPLSLFQLPSSSLRPWTQSSSLWPVLFPIHPTHWCW